MQEERFGKRLYELRIKKGITAREMSLSLGQNPGYINSIENNKGLPRMSSFFYICEYLGVTPEEFFAEKQDDPALLKEATALLRSLDSETIQHIIALLKDLKKK